MRPWKSNYITILIAETIAIAGFGVSGPVIPSLLEEIGITDPKQLNIWYGFIQSLPSISLAIFAPIWGKLADLYSRKAMLVRAMFGGAVILSLMAFTTHPWQMLVLRSLQGCFTGTVAAATVLIAGIVPAAKIGLALGLLQTGVSIGNSLGPLLGGVLADFIGIRAAFITTGLILLVATFITIKWVEDDVRPPKAELEDAPKERGAKRFLPDIKPILASPALLALMAVTFVIQASNTLSGTALPLILRQMVEGRTLINSTNGAVLMAGAIATALATFIIGKYASRFGYWRTLIFCLGAGCILTVPQIFMQSVWQLAVFRSLSLFFIGGAIPVVNAIIATITEKDHQGSVYGFNTTVSSTGAALGPLISSGVSVLLGFRAVFVLIFVILGMSCFGTYKRRKRIVVESC